MTTTQQLMAPTTGLTIEERVDNQRQLLIQFNARTAAMAARSAAMAARLDAVEAENRQLKEALASKYKELRERQDAGAQNQVILWAKVNELDATVSELEALHFESSAVVSALTRTVQGALEIKLPAMQATTLELALETTATMLANAVPAPMATVPRANVSAHDASTVPDGVWDSLRGVKQPVPLSGKKATQSVAIDAAVLADIKARHGNFCAYIKKLLVDDNPEYAALLDTIRQRDSRKAA